MRGGRQQVSVVQMLGGAGIGAAAVRCGENVYSSSQVVDRIKAIESNRDAEVRFGPVLRGISENLEPEPDLWEAKGRTANQNRENRVRQVRFGFNAGSDL